MEKMKLTDKELVEKYREKFMTVRKFSVSQVLAKHKIVLGNWYGLVDGNRFIKLELARKMDKIIIDEMQKMIDDYKNAWEEDYESMWIGNDKEENQAK